MPYRHIESRTKTVKVAAVGTSQVFLLGWKVKKGDIIQLSTLRRLLPSEDSTDSTWQFALTTAGLVLGTTIDTEGVLDTIAPSSVTNYLVLANDVAELRYVQGSTDGAVAPQARANMLIIRNRGDL